MADDLDDFSCRLEGVEHFPCGIEQLRWITGRLNHDAGWILECFFLPDCGGNTMAASVLFHPLVSLFPILIPPLIPTTGIGNCPGWDSAKGRMCRNRWVGGEYTVPAQTIDLLWKICSLVR